jgi:pimeloyl-ACP methyl ester carboxylesterase
VSTATGALMVPARPAVLARMLTPRRYTDPGYLRSVASVLYGGSARTQPDRVMASMHADSRVGSPQGYLYQLAAGTGWTSLPFLPLIRQPTLIVSGDDDPLIPRARLHVYSGGHLGLVTEAAELAPVVSRFLGGLDE